MEEISVEKNSILNYLFFLHYDIIKYMNMDILTKKMIIFHKILFFLNYHFSPVYL